jgi:hypothetical protein
MKTATFKTSTAMICGITFAAISIYCSALLWWSFAETLTDQIIAAIIGSGFVVCQYLFHANKNYLTTAVLFAISAAATIGWIESRYDSIKTIDLTSNASYSEKAKTLTQLNNTLALQNLSAQNDLANTSANYTGRANRTLNQAKQTQAAIARIESEIEHLKNSDISSKKSGATIANHLDQYRWILWALLAAMIDLIPMRCFTIAHTQNTKNTKERNVANNVTENVAHNHGKGWQPESQQAATPLHIVASNATENTAENIELDPLTKTIAGEIIANKYGEKPSQRRVMKKHNLRHERTKNIFDELMKMNVIQPQGNRFIRTQKLAQTSNKEHTA